MLKTGLFWIRSFLYWITLGKKPNRLVDKFKIKILEMHDGIPNYYFSGVEPFFKHKEILNYYIDNNVLVKSKEYKFNTPGLVKINQKNDSQRNAYFLGINGMLLANSYINEKLTVRITILTILLVILTTILLIMTLSLIN